MIPPGVTQAAYRFSLAGDQEEMVVTMGHLADGVGGDYQGLADDLRAIFQSTWQPSLRDSYTFEGVSLYVGQDAPGTLVYESLDPVSGAAASDGLPSNCAALLRKSTGTAGRRGKGRCYIPGILGEASVDELGIINSTILGQLNTAATAWYTALTDPLNVGCTPVLLHATAPFDPTPITEFGIDDLIVTQRQRMRR